MTTIGRNNCSSRAVYRLTEMVDDGRW